MNIGSRGRLLFWSLVFITVVDLGVGLYLESQLEASSRARFRDELSRQARVVGEALQGVERPELDPMSDRFGAALGSRVSVVGPRGNLLADSELDAEGLSNAENHGKREEVVEARQGHVGIARRHSATLGTDMLYVAERVHDGRGRVVRVSLPLSQVDEARQRLRFILLFAGLVALGAATVLVTIASRLFAGRLRDLVISAQSEMRGRPEPGDEESEPRSVHALAEELERTLRLLGNERERFETVLETMRQAVLAIDVDRRVSMVNQAARDLLELPENVEGRPLLDFIRVPALEQLIARAAEGESASAEFEFGTSPARQIQIQAQANASRQGGGTVIVMHDITELRRLETVRQDFIANVSHELRTPVAVIRANAETLMAGAIDEPERAAVFLDALVRHADRLGRLVADLLDISRIEAGLYALEIAPVDLEVVIDRTIVALAIQAEDRGTTLRSCVEEERWISGEEKALEQVLFNLVTNAIQHTPAGGHIEIDVHEGPHEEGIGWVRMEVRDDGPGIDPRHHQRVFERFYRVDSGRTRDIGGTGLGLAIVKHLVEAMGGQVGVDARRPRGSVFWFTIPRDRHPRLRGG